MPDTGVKEIIPSSLYRTVVAIDHHGSITNAARALRLSQSAVSSQVRRLERILGGTVFDRSGSGVKLTKRGTIVLEYAQRMLALNDQLLDYAGPNANPRQFSIGLPRWLWREKLVEIFKACTANACGESCASAATMVLLSCRSWSLACSTSRSFARPTIRRSRPSSNGPSRCAGLRPPGSDARPTARSR